MVYRDIGFPDDMATPPTGISKRVTSMDTLFLRIAEGFSPTEYIFWTKIQLVAWSAADIALVFAVLRIVGLARAHAGNQRIRVRYVLLAASAGLTSVVLVLESSQQIFRLEAAVVGLQFAILIYSIIVDRQPVLRLLLRRGRCRANKANGPMSPGTGRRAP